VQGPGRPPDLTPALEHAICDLVRAGVPLVDAAHALELGERTVYRWVARGRAGDGVLYVRFVVGLADARRERAHDVGRLIAAARDRIV
jgi:hypothetical protein